MFLLIFFSAILCMEETNVSVSTSLEWLNEIKYQGLFCILTDANLCKFHVERHANAVYISVYIPHFTHKFMLILNKM